MSRRTKDERRRDYLELGAEIVAESQGAPDAELGLSHVKIADVAVRAGVTKGALYHIWDSQEDYWRDLLDHLLDNQRLLGAQRIAELSRELAGAPAEETSLMDLADVVFDSYRGDPSFFARISLYSYLPDESVRATLDHEFRDAAHRVGRDIEARLAESGLRLRDGVTFEVFATALFALLDGLWIKRRVDEERTADVEIDGRRTTLFGVGAEALVLALTEPVRPAEAMTGGAN